jgi:hypothetical protein
MTGADEPLDWAALAELRAGFLGERPGGRGDYWSSPAHLRSYDATFAKRIGWKWRAVLRDLAALGWQPPAGRPALYDWGCGTGIASRTVLEAWGADAVSAVWLHDRSRAAMAFAASRQPPGLPVRQGPAEGPYVLLLSHVANELDEAGLDSLYRLAAAAAAVLWVEPGTPAAGRALSQMRERLRPRLTAVAPCLHQEPCGLLAAGNERHWCHHFAGPPPEVFTSRRWAEFGRRMCIDLRSLPVSYLVMQRDPGPPADAAARVIGRPRQHKGGCTFLACGAAGVTERRLLKRHDAALFKRLEADGFGPVIRLETAPPGPAQDGSR